MIVEAFEQEVWAEIERVSKRQSDPSNRVSFTPRGYAKFCRNGRGAFVHRLIAMRKLGRPLKANEVVHHIDGNRANNDPDNLEVMTASKHASIHGPNPFKGTIQRAHERLNEAARKKAIDREAYRIQRAYAKARIPEDKLIYADIG